LHHNENTAQLEIRKGKWVDVLSSRRKRDGKPEVKCALPIPTIANRCELLNNLNQPTSNTVENTLDKKSDNELEQKGIEARASARCRKHQMTRKDDFLWSTGLSKREI
jgi:hypothetical protein